MIQDASSYIFQQPWLMVPTGVVLALTVIAANELADAIAGRASAKKRIRRRRRRAAAPRRGGRSASADADGDPRRRRA